MENKTTVIIAENTEIVNGFPDEKSLIVVKQLPIIEEQLYLIREQFQNQTEYALSLECNEETKKLVKEQRAALSKVFNALEDKRKEVKRTVLEPYEEFEKVYKSCVTDIYKPCDEELKQKIKKVDDGLIARKYEEAKAYFNEYCASRNIGFLNFTDVGLTINLTISKKILMENIKKFVDSVADDLAVIDTMDASKKAEILVEYKQTLRLGEAVQAVEERRRALSFEEQFIEERETSRAKMAEVIESVERSAFEFAAPKAEEIPAEIAAAPEPQPKVGRAIFKVFCTEKQLKDLKNFMIERGIKYESIQPKQQQQQSARQ